MFKALGFVVLLLFTSCASFSTPAQCADACPIVVDYSASFQKQAATEIADLNPDSNLVKMLEDYAALRQEARDCK